MNVNKRIEEIRKAIEHQLKIKEGAKKIRHADNAEGHEASEMAKKLIKKINEDLEDLRNELNILRAQVHTLKEPNIEMDVDMLLDDKTDTSNMRFEQTIEFYKKALDVETQVKDGIGKMMQAVKNKSSDSSSELVLLYRDAITKTEYLRMLILITIQKNNQIRKNKDENDMVVNNNTMDAQGYAIPRFMDLTPDRIKAKIESSSKMLKGAIEIKKMESLCKTDSFKHTLKKMIPNSSSPSPLTESSDQLMDFLQQLIVIHHRSLTKCVDKQVTTSSEDLKLMETFAKKAMITGTLRMTLHGVTHLDEDIIRDSKALAKGNTPHRKSIRCSSSEEINSSISVIVNIDANTLYQSSPVIVSHTCFQNKFLELALFKNKNIEFIIKSSYTNVMVAFTSLTLIEFLDGEIHKIRIPLEPSGYIYCVIQYIVPRPRVAKVERQKQVLFRSRRITHEHTSFRHKTWTHLITPTEKSQDDFKKLSVDKDVDKANEIKKSIAESRSRKPTQEELSISKHSMSNIDTSTRASQILVGNFESLKEKRKDSTQQDINVDAFKLLYVIGQGHFGKVLLAEMTSNKTRVALKSITKLSIVVSNDFDTINSEKKIFILSTEYNHPFLIHLYCCFTTREHLCFVMEYASAGDLMTHIHIEVFSESRSIFYAACVLLGLEFLHEHGVIYRDLKLDNIMMTSDGYVKLGDFGLCKTDMWHDCHTNTFCGTPEFIAPEILSDKSYTRAIDWWELGILIYEMLIYESPFPGDDEAEIFDSILFLDIKYPTYLSSLSKDILQKLINKNPKKRLGSSVKDAKEIKAHPFFNSIDFDALSAKEIIPEYIPAFKKGDISYIDDEFLYTKPIFTVPEDHLSSLTNEQKSFFKNFAFSFI